MTNQPTPHRDPSPGPDAQDATGLPGPAADVFAALTGKTECTAAELARTTGLGRSTATKALAHLEQCGLAVRTRGQLEGGRRTPDRWEPAPERAAGPDTAEHTEPNPTPTNAESNTNENEADGSPDTAHPADDTAAAVDDGHNATPSSPKPSADPAPDTRPTTPPRTGRLAPGALRKQVLSHLQAHPTEAFTATQISRAIERSSGAIANALATLTTKGLAEQVTDTPRRYRLTEAGAADAH
ncbi:MarR family transcriptional regulator [Streptomyces synnematoformans]|uniref:HTH marR-type domain-containing protein n=1 Tax=Streptomyces synnematoformans TaxID=415721 RepID=A0ABN2XFD3_9ACTN